MNFQTILLSALGIVLTALVSWATERLIAWLNVKTKNLKSAKLINDAVGIVTDAVKATYQTYVQSLKDKDLFNAEEQKTALNKAKQQALSQLSADTTKYIETEYGNAENWITATIESVLYDLKNGKTESSEKSIE